MYTQKGQLCPALPLYLVLCHCKCSSASSPAPPCPSHPSIQSSALLMYAVGHAIQAGVNQEVFTACDVQSQFNRIDMLGLTDTTGS